MLDRILKNKYSTIFVGSVSIAAVLGVHVFNVMRFSFFPEVDSYGWFFIYNDNIKNSVIGDYRPLFESLILNIHYLTGLSLFNIFKYIVPAFSLLTLIPLWLIARNLKNRISRLLIMLSPLISPVVIFQSESTRPQSVGIIFLFFMIAFIIESYKKDIFIYLALAVGMIGTLYHQIFIFFFLAVILGHAYIYRTIIFKNKLKTTAYFFLFIPWISLLNMEGMILAIPKLIRDIFFKIFIQFDLNFSFPLWYINSDGIQMGWKNTWGVIKYYSFYAGPVSFLIILIFLIFLSSNIFRSFLKKELNNKFLLPLYFLVFFFLAITEFFPRIGNIAFLPDRAWTFLGILLIFPFFQLLKFLEAGSFIGSQFDRIIYAGFFGAFAVSIFGSIYVIDSIKYTLPDFQQESFNWIKNNLESDRVVFYSGYPSILRYHSESTVLPISKDAFKSGDMRYFMSLFISNDILRDNNETFSKIKSETASINAYVESMQYLFAVDHGLVTDQVLNYASSLKNHSDTLISTLEDYELKSGNIYIYYTKSSDKNPFNERMYDTGYSSQAEAIDGITLDRYPDYFKRVYDTGNVIIWKYIGNQRNASS